MSSVWASIFEHPGTDPDADRTVLEGGGQRTLLVPVTDQGEAPEVAERLVREDGATLIELCGGFRTAAVAAVIAAVGDRAAVGHVTYAVDAVQGAADFAASFGD